MSADFSGEEHFAGRLLASDARVAYLLLNEARRRGVARYFGVSGNDSVLVTLVLAGLAARAIHGRTMRTLRAPAAPGLGDSMLGLATLRELVHGIVGQPYPDSPMLGALVVTAFVGAAVVPVVKGTTRGIEALSRRIRLDFDHRYGHLVRTGRASRG
jgi:hypothetical protein